MNYRWHSDASAEFDAAVDYYLFHASPATSRKFAVAVQEAVKLILNHPEIGVHVVRGNRKRWVRKFPFDLIYRLHEGEVLIVAIANHSRRPGYWAGRR